MAEYSIQDTTLTTLANSVRTATGNHDTYTPAQMASTVGAIMAIPESFYTLTGYLYDFYSGAIGETTREIVWDDIVTSNVYASTNFFNNTAPHNT